MTPKKKVKKPRKKLPSARCVSTRASRRNSTSPLRELPMYGVLKKRKKLRKIKAAMMKKKAAARKEKLVVIIITILSTYSHTLRS